MITNPIVLKLRDLDDTGTEEALRNKAQALADNLDLAPDIDTTPALLLAAADLIVTKRTAKAVADAAALAATGSRNEATEAGQVLLADYAGEVWKATGKSVEKVKILDFDVRGDGPPPPPPNDGQMTGLSLKGGPNPGSLIVRADPMERKMAIECQVNHTPNAAPTWVGQPPFTATPHTLTGLPSGTLVQVRIRAIFANGVLGPWSDIAELRVP